MADNNNEFAVIHSKLDQIIEANSELKEDLKQYKQTSDNKLTDLTTRLNKNEQDIQLLELKLQHLESLHKADMERAAKKWDWPSKIMFSVFGTGMGVLITALLNLILK